MSNETKPLLSDARIRGMNEDDKMTPYEVRDLYEAERTKLMAVLQVCADALKDARITQGNTFLTDDALSQLKAIGVEPNK